MTNFLNETLDAIIESGHTPSDVIYIGSTGEDAYSCTWEEFKKIADVEYNPGYGSAQVATDLRIVFADGADMHRGEYDGSEWWEFSQPFVAPISTKPIRHLVGRYWPSTSELQDPSDTHHAR